MLAALALALHLAGWLLIVLAGAGTLYMLLAAYTVVRFFAVQASVDPTTEAVTLLKPLHGDEPRLKDNLASFLDQRHDGPVQLLCGIGSENDTARRAVEALRAERPDARIDLTVAGDIPGANRKIANLIGMMPAAAHDLLVLSDSDMAAAPDYLARIVAVLDAPGTGAVTCLYRGRGDAGFWSRLGAAGISWQFLPGAVFGVAHGLAKPCMGSTIALRRETLAAIGGFAAFRDTLADDYAVGAAVRALGLAVAVPPMLVTHGSTERSFAELWRHELRWSVTVRGVAPAEHAASIIALPLPLALLGFLLAGLPMVGLIVLLLALAARLLAIAAVDRAAGEPSANPLWLPLRDLLSLAVHLASFLSRSVDWRGAQLTLKSDGRIQAAKETSP